MDEQGDKQLTLVTYNIHRCIGRDGHFSPDRVAKVLKPLQADFIALQEVETRNEGGLNLLQKFSEETGMTEIVTGPTLYRSDSAYGNALLSRHRLQDYHTIDISHPGREPRGCISVTAHINRHRIHLMATHLGLRPAERRAQVRSLLSELEQQPADISILMGDLNEWFLWGRPLRWLHHHFTRTSAPRSFPTWLPMLSLDRIWVDPRASLRSIYQIKTPLARAASDHLPIAATLIVGEGETGHERTQTPEQQ